MSELLFAYTLGYVPNTFPRDPVEFNLYDEHLLIGQILKPLIETDKNGDLIPSIAKEWSYSKDRKKLFFKISDISFSNGKKITSEDVKYTLERHINKKSQSAEYLKSIEKIKIINEKEFEIILSNVDSALIKALTRDQLGIVPSGWTFNPNSKEPYISTSEFTLIKDTESNWMIKSNKNEKIFFNLVYYLNEKQEVPEKVPNIVLSLTKNTIQNNEKIFSKYSKNLYEINSFGQTLFWIFKKGQIYNDNGIRACTSSILTNVINMYSQKNDLRMATGLIPVGIAGSSNIPINKELVDTSKCKFPKEIKIFYLIGAHNKFIEESQIKSEFKKNNINVILKPYGPGLNLDEMYSSADIIITSIAGGFNDPAGFIGVLSKSFGMSFEEYLPSSLVSYYNDARTEHDFKKRISLFEKLNTKLVSNNYCIPGWRTSVFTYYDNNFVKDDYIFRYTPRLENYKNVLNK